MIPVLVIGAVALWLYNRAQPAAPAAFSPADPAVSSASTLASVQDFSVQPASTLPGGPTSVSAPHAPAPPIFQPAPISNARVALTNIRQRLLTPGAGAGAPGAPAFFADVTQEGPTEEIRFLNMKPPLPPQPTSAVVSTLSATPQGLGGGGGGIGGGGGGIGGGVGGHGVELN